MKKLVWIFVFTMALSLCTACHPSNAGFEQSDDGQLAVPTDPTKSDETKPEESSPKVTLPQNPTLGAGTSADPQLDMAIVMAYCRHTGTDLLTEGKEMQVRYFGEFGDLYAVYVDGPWMYTQAIRNVTVFGCKFIFPDGQRMYLYRDGQICALDEAEREVFATQEEIQDIWIYYQEKAGHLYGNDAATE